MFDLYKVENLVKNKALKRAFNFSIINHEHSKILKIEKKKSSIPILFFVNLSYSYSSFFNLLKEEYFPSSIPILSSIGRKIVQSDPDETDRLVRASTRVATWLEDYSIRQTIFKCFKYKKIKFDGSRLVYPGKNIYEHWDEIRKHVLIQYFQHIVSKGLYEENVYLATLRLFETSSSISKDILETLKCLKYIDGDLKYSSLFVGRESVTYGSALAASVKGEKVFQGNLPWDSFFAKKDSSESLLEEVAVSSAFLETISNVEDKFYVNRDKVLTENPDSDYNKSIPDIVYWNVT